QMERIGGMFEHVFPASANFGISVEAQLTNNKAYDSLWNWALAAKSNDKCSFIDEWAAWQRIDFSDHENRWVWLWKDDESDVDVSQPYEAEDDWGFAPTDCPQHDNGTGLYVYAFSLNMTLGDGEHFLPMLYPVIQDRTSIEKGKDTYAQTVSVYPLPATDKVNIVALDPIQKVELYNMAGTLLKQITMNDNVLEFDVTSYAPGTYIAKITTEKGVASKKLLVK
ncbi:MAG: T9SS type A sorting domain-containing protein, partial [Bacteroidales bacterium]|nr:T9SS type A sorting domain-containing protein [Bacteroidales bacterium]